MIPAVRGMSRSSSAWASGPTGVVWMIATISVPPEVSRTHDVSGRRARATAMSCAVRVAAVSRTNHWWVPELRGAGSATTRRPACAYRRR